jgi:uncharacterized membrane protein (UPF0182 family)
VYLRAEGGGIPELKRVVVAYQNQVVMEETLEAGLARLFSGAAAPAATLAEASPAGQAGDGEGGAAALTRQAVQLYQSAVAAQRAGDWARYGAELARLGEVLRQLQAALEARRP